MVIPDSGRSSSGVALPENIIGAGDYATDFDFDFDA
jgi:hypothetical protein